MRVNPSRLEDVSYKEMIDKYSQLVEEVEQIASKEAHFQTKEEE